MQKITKIKKGRERKNREFQIVKLDRFVFQYPCRGELKRGRVREIETFLTIMREKPSVGQDYGAKEDLCF